MQIQARASRLRGDSIMKKKTVVITLTVLSCISVMLFVAARNFTPRPEIIAIPNGQFYSTGFHPRDYATYKEFFIIVNPPRTVRGMRRLIIEFNESNPVVPTHPPPDYVNYVTAYSRVFFRLSNLFTRDFEFSEEFTPQDAMRIEDNAVFDRVAWAFGTESQTGYWFTPGNRSRYGYHHIPSPGRADVRLEFPPDPMLNGLLYHIPYHQIPPFGRNQTE